MSLFVQVSQRVIGAADSAVGEFIAFAGAVDFCGQGGFLVEEIVWLDSIFVEVDGPLSGLLHVCSAC